MLKERLEQIRTPDQLLSYKTKVVVTMGMVLCGLFLGVIQKWLDGGAYNEFPVWMQTLDLGNYFGRLSFWILTSVVISVSSENPWRASLNTFVFLLSMLAGYYVYCKFVAGFLPVAYMMFWIVAAFAAIPAAFVCWFAKGEGWIAIILSAGILGVLFSQAILVLPVFHVTHLLDVLTWLAGLAVLYRKPREYVVTIMISLGVAVIYQMIFPYFG